MCVCVCVCVCRCMCVCVCGGGGGDRVVLPPRGDPWELDPVMLSVRRGTRGLTTCGVPVPPHVGAKPQVDKTARSSVRKNASLFHAKVKTRIACWNVRTLGRLSEQSEKLLGLVQTMEEKKIELMALSETRWTGQGVERIKNKTFIYSGCRQGPELWSCHRTEQPGSSFLGGSRQRVPSSIRTYSQNTDQDPFWSCIYHCCICSNQSNHSK